jgi:hypothetical protein
VKNRKGLMVMVSNPTRFAGLAILHRHKIHIVINLFKTASLKPT